ncbi:RNA polymerase factor sigma-54 [Robiginitomaculum antarcticum]|uniref:RNA polymerase factor sigma-54 n=1 Tax=Robiginitomaculum antarcticum TaxID=437507 RepID=UPI00037EF020|nr:RNA polymerase factor sigma-54 [Robiginitomaculum antarcticum]
MAISQRLKLKQSQSLVMTPQLQQAIKLLQLSNIELAAFVEEQLESNPLLERGTGDENRRGEEAAQTSPDSDYSEMELSTSDAAASDAIDAPDHAMDSEASYAETNPPAPAADVGGTVDWSKSSSAGGSFNSSGDYDAAANTAAELTLQDALTEQFAMTAPDMTERLIGANLIDHVDENGYLQASVLDIAMRLGVDIDRVEQVLLLMQTFDPIGVMARDLRECLALQLKERGQLCPSMEALLDNLRLLAGHDLGKLAKCCNVSRDTLNEMIQSIKKLSPKPGLRYGSSASAVVEPDIFVREKPNGGWAVELNSDTLPRVLVNSRYYAEVCALTSDEQTRTFMSECQANASWLVKSLDQRARTILKVASELVKQQDGFFAYGIDHMRPLNLKQIADAIEMHESTVSRVTSNKYMATPRGTFELKYFFTAAIPAIGGAPMHSAETVRHKIKILISEEVVTNVLSDDKIVDLLRAQGIDIARRTVAKYRESMGVQSSVERRRQLKAGS